MVLVPTTAPRSLLRSSSNIMLAPRSPAREHAAPRPKPVGVPTFWPPSGANLAHPSSGVGTWPPSGAMLDQRPRDVWAPPQRVLFQEHQGVSTDLIIKHHCSQNYNASSSIPYSSRYLAGALKKKQSKGTKNKFQQLKNTALKAIAAAMSQDRSKRHVGTAVPVRKILGIGFEFAGRVYGAKKAATFKMLLGSVPFNTLDARIDYSYIMQKTRNGT